MDRRSDRSPSPSPARRNRSRRGNSRNGAPSEYEARQTPSRPHRTQAVSPSPPPPTRRPRRRRRDYREARAHSRGRAEQASAQVPEQDSDDVLDEAFGGGGGADLSDTAVEDEFEVRPTTRIYGAEQRPPPRPASGFYPGAPSKPYASAPAEDEPVLESWPSRPSAAYAEARPPMLATARIHEITKTSSRNDFLREAPPGFADRGLWARAATTSKTADRRRPDSRALTLSLKLLLTRRGERYKGREFAYTRGAWDDRDLAVRLQREYRSLKTRNIGWLQKLTSYRRISFVYFLQYHAYPSRGLPGGYWKISSRVPITPLDDEVARSAFMFKLSRLLHERRGDDPVLRMLSGGKGRARCTRDWTARLDRLVEPGAVIDIEVKEAFDTVKIYIFTIVAVLLSLAAALAYGFATPDRDFATGFGLASWVVTAFAFVLAVIVGGEWIGLEKPGASLVAADLATGAPLDRQLLEYR